MLGGPEQMATLAEPMAETYKMPDNWFQQDFLRSVAKGRNSQGSHFSVLVPVRANTVRIKAWSVSKGALSFSNLFLSLAISFQRVIPFTLTLHNPPLLWKPVMLYTRGQKQLEIRVVSTLSHSSFADIKHTKKSEALWLNCCHRNLMVIIPLVIMKTIPIGIVMACTQTHTYTPTNTCSL